MKWRDAVKESKRGVAERFDSFGRQVWRWGDGVTYAYHMALANPTPIPMPVAMETSNSLEHDDWTPALILD
jgi:hypothetical protein